MMRKEMGKKSRDLLKRVGIAALALVVAGGGFTGYKLTHKQDIPELTVFTDPEAIAVSEDEVPLAAPKVTKKVTTKTTTKKTTMKTKAKKNGKTTKKSSKQNNKTSKSSGQQIQKNTKVDTTIVTTTKKNSKVKTTTTTVKTTVTTTTTSLPVAYNAAAPASSSSTPVNQAAAGTYNIKNVAPRCDARVLNAYTQMGCSVVVNPSVSYSGCFDAAKRTITLKTLDGTVYHELGHFVEFTGGVSAVKQAIAAAYNSEKSLYTAYNKAYVLQNSSEYFAESFRNYCENPAALQQQRPQTYNAIVMALGNVTENRVNMLLSVYGSVWNK